MISHKKAAVTKRTADREVTKTLSRERIEALLREGHELRRSVHERFKALRAVGDSAMRFFVR